MPPQSKAEIKNLPDWAETRFQLLCDEAGVVRNKAFQDRTGWDYIVEFDRVPVPNLAHDRQPGSVTARVQVKSKKGGGPRVQIKLSNALRFCREPGPCFVVLFLTSKNGLFSKIFAREFDEELMSLTLRRAREADRDGLDDLHKIRIGIPFGSTDDHSHDLLEWLRARSIEDPDGYARRKASLNRSLGVEKGSIRGSITIAASDIPALVEHSVGLRPYLEVERVRLEDVRFDVPARSPIFEGKPSSFKMEVHPKRAKLTFRGSNGRVATFPGEWRAISFPGLSREHQRATFISPHITGEVREEGAFRLKYHLPTDERQSISALRNQIAFQLAARSIVTPSLWVEGLGDLEMLNVSIQAGDNWADWFDGILEVLATVPRRRDKPMLSLDDLGLQQETTEHFIAALLDRELRLTINLAQEPSEPLRVRTIAYYAYLQAGDSVFTVIAHRPCLEQEQDGDRVSMRFGDPIVLDSAARRGNIEQHLPVLRRRFERLSEKLGKGMVTLENGDFMRVGEGDARVTT